MPESHFSTCTSLQYLKIQLSCFRIRESGCALPPLSCSLSAATPFQDLREAFRIFDKNHNGYIDAKEIIAVTTTLGQALTKEELEQFMAEADLDGDGKLNYEEFVKVMTKDWE